MMGRAEAEADARQIDRELAFECSCGHTLGFHDFPAAECMAPGCKCTSFALAENASPEEEDEAREMEREDQRHSIAEVEEAMEERERADVA